MAFFQSKTTWVQPLGEDIAVVAIDPPSRVNTLDLALVEDLNAAFDAVAREARFQVVCIRSAKANSFAQNLDPADWGTLSPEDADRLCAAGQQLVRRIIELGKTTIAWVQGLCLGAGLEIALACDWRISAGKGGASFGFTEMEMGLIPAWGGIHQLPNLVGLDRSLRMLLGGKWLTAREALAWNLIDGVSESPAPEIVDLADFRMPRDRSRQVRRGWKEKLASLFPFTQRVALRRGEQALKKRLAEEFDAPREAFESLRSGIGKSIEAAQSSDREAFGKLVRSEAFRNLLRLRELRERFKPEGPREDRFRRVAILGAKGQGMDLLEWLVGRNFAVLLREPDESTLGWSFFRVLKSYEDQIRKGTITSAEMARRLGLIRSTAGWKNFVDVDLVLDLSIGGEPSKPEFFAEMAKHLGDDTILAATSPAVDLMAIQAAVPHPERVAAVRFVSMTTAKFPLLELAGSARTSQQTMQRLHEWAGQIGKSAVRTSDRLGGVFWRLWLPAWNESLALLREGFLIEEIDQAMIRFGMVQGPLEHLDLLGIDVALACISPMQAVYGDRIAFDPAWGLFEERGWMGQESGTGFWRALRRGRRAENAYLANILRSEGPLPGSAPAVVSRADRPRHIQKRIVDRMVAEAKLCVEERVVADADTLDFAMMMTGWAPHRGGPLRYAARDQ
jgi:3-hydroxyacyl-CoA dehydrogenase/enoyl-CoA hydratase/3-hydroxybutyryl-CoA epimerase